MLTAEQRRRNMQAIRGRDTRPEMLVRSLVHRMGFRFRLHRRDLPGAPDLVLPRHRKVLLVHGCYWHCHRCRFGRVVPRTNAKFWQARRAGNVARDRRNLRRLRRLGWQVLIIWECQTRNPDPLKARLKSFLTPTS